MGEMNEIIRDAVFLALKEYDKSKVEKGKKKAINNTRLLLRNYNELNNHSVNAIYCKKTRDRKVGDNQNTLYSDDEIFIESIKKSKIKTLIMIEHINMALARVEDKHSREGTVERYEAMCMLHIDKKKKSEIAEKLNCSEKSCSRWIKEVEEEVAMNIFGINSIEYLVV